MSSIAEIFSKSQMQALQRNEPTPLYFRLYSLLKNAILDGTIGNGAQMPTEQQLAESFGVSRITAKRAMDELAAEDMVVRHRGKGSHVTYEYIPQPVRAPLVGMLQEIESMARHSDVQLLECKKQKPPAAVREALGIKDSDRVLHLIRIRSRDGQPFGYFDSWTTGLGRAVRKRDFLSSSRMEVFRRLGLTITHVTQKISAVAANSELANHLQTEPGAPLLSLARHSFETHAGEEHLVDCLQVYYHPDRFQYQMDLELDEG